LAKRVSLNLALQGGGAHGAFTWGVLDRLLEDAAIDFTSISATSAGAVNAVALASGLTEGSREKARERLFKVWQAVHQSGVPDLSRFNMFFGSLGRSSQLPSMATMWSPYEFNPLGFDPLRRLLSEHVDFDAIRQASPIKLYVAATHVATGRARLFREHEITIEAVLASACLPTIHHAVDIDGQMFWDGGYSANPDLITLATNSDTGDTLIVLVAPRVSNDHPTTSRDIAMRANRMQFNAPLLKDIEVILAVRETAGTIISKGRYASLNSHRFHLIDGGEVTSNLNPETVIKPDWSTMQYLHGAGRSHADDWLKVNRRRIGRKETIDLEAHFFGDIPVAQTVAADVSETKVAKG
jgi:NTE family protein